MAIIKPEQLSSGSYSITGSFKGNFSGSFIGNGSEMYINNGIIYTGSNWVDNNNGTITLPTLDVVLYNDLNWVGEASKYTIDGGTTGIDFISLYDEDTNYVYVSYNSGNPIFNISNIEPDYNRSDLAKYLTLYRAGNFLHVLDWDSEGSGLSNKILNRIYSTNFFERESGLILSLSGSTGIVLISGGIIWNGVQRTITPTINSNDDTFFVNYHTSGSWDRTTSLNTINNNYYDDGTNLVVLGSNKYVVNWFYKGIESAAHIYEVIGTNQYSTISQAQLEDPPQTPNIISSHAVLVGRIIVRKGENIGVIESAFTHTFNPTQVTSHNDLSELQGGTSDQYYHLTLDQYNNNTYNNSSNTFTSDQYISGSLFISGSIESNSFVGNGSQLTNLPPIFKYESSCILTSSISINGVDNSKFDFSISGYIIDPALDIRVDVEYTNTSISVPDIATQNATFLLVDKNSTLVFQSTKPTKDQLSNHLGLWVLVHSNNTDINVINSLPINTENIGSQVIQLMDILGTMREGLEIAPGTNTTKISYSSGILFRPGINDLTNLNDKNSLELSQSIDLTFRIRLSDGTETGDLTTLPSIEYESGGVLVAATGVKVLAYPVFIFPSSQIRLQYSQYQYANMQTALVQIQTDAFILEENIQENGTHIGWILIQRNTSDWSDPSKYTFIILDRFGQSAVGSSVIPTMNNVYLVSTQPQIEVNDTQGAIQNKNLRSNQTGSTEEWLDSTGGVVASIDGLGNFYIKKELWTVELIDALTVDFYAPYNLVIDSVTNILNSPTTTILDDDIAYTLGATIVAGSKITVTVDLAAVVNLNVST